MNLRHFLSFLFVTLFAHAYTFFRVKHHKQIIIDTLGNKMYVCTVVPHFLFFFALLGFLVVNLFFVLGDTSAVGLMKTGLKNPFKRVRSIGWNGVKRAFKKRFGSDSIFSVLFSFGIPEIMLKQRLVKEFNRTYNSEVEIVESQFA